MDRRQLVGLLIFVVGTALCGLWAYQAISSVMGQGSGGIGAVSAGAAEALIALLSLFVPQLVTFQLTKRSGGERLATVLRWSHLLASVGLAGMVVLGQIFLAMLLFLPMQAFFVTAAVALRIARPKVS